MSAYLTRIEQTRILHNMAAAGASLEAMAAMNAEIERRAERKEQLTRERQRQNDPTIWVSVRCGYG